jgi:hypothetical protein
MPNKATATLLDNELTSAYMYVGSAGNVATGVVISGVIAVSNTGVTSFVAGAIKNADIAASGTADIAWNKLVAGTASRAMVTDASGYPTVSTVTAAEVNMLAGIGATTIATQLSNILDGTTDFTVMDSGNIRITVNTISSQDANGDINITPNGSGKTVIDDVVIVTQLDMNGLSIILDADGDTYMKCNADDIITFYVWDGAASTAQINISDGIIQPVASADIALGDVTHVFSALYVDSIVINGSTISGTSSDVILSCDNLNDISLRAGGGGDISIGIASDKVGFYGETPVIKGTGTGADGSAATGAGAGAGLGAGFGGAACTTTGLAASVMAAGASCASSPSASSTSSLSRRDCTNSCSFCST